jgi:hypothetical protein
MVLRRGGVAVVTVLVALVSGACSTPSECRKPPLARTEAVRVAEEHLVRDLKDGAVTEPRPPLRSATYDPSNRMWTVEFARPGCTITFAVDACGSDESGLSGCP